MEKYQNRQQAGQILAKNLQQFAHKNNVLVLGLPRGGVPVAFEIAKTLHAPLDVIIVRKLGVPGHEELAMGALASGGIVFFNHSIINELNISQADIDIVIAQEFKELKRREMAYRQNKAFPDVTAKTVILVDDGIATGATIRAAIMALRQLGVAKLILAVPLGQKDLCRQLVPLVDDLICPLMPVELNAVGAWYEFFAQTEDEEVYQLLNKAKKFTSTYVK